MEECTELFVPGLMDFNGLQVGECVEIKSSVQEEGEFDQDLAEVKPKLTELAVAGGSGDGRNHFATLVNQSMPPPLTQAPLPPHPRQHPTLVTQPMTIKQELVEGGYKKGVQDKNIILALIYQLPVDNVPYYVTHEDLVKALATPNDKVSVRTMRRTLPCLRIVAYMKTPEFNGKKKIKGLWNKRPEDWPDKYPYKDPNNGEKINGVPVPKANSQELRAMFHFLKTKFMTNIKNEIDQMSDEEKANLPAAPQMTMVPSGPISSGATRKAVKRPAAAQAPAQPSVQHSQELPTFVQSETFENSYHQTHQVDMEEEEEEPDVEEGVLKEAYTNLAYGYKSVEQPETPSVEAASQGFVVVDHDMREFQYVKQVSEDVREHMAGAPRYVTRIDDQGQVKSELQELSAAMVAPSPTPAATAVPASAIWTKRPKVLAEQPSAEQHSATADAPPPTKQSLIVAPSEDEDDNSSVEMQESPMCEKPLQRQDSHASTGSLAHQVKKESKPYVIQPQQPSSQEPHGAFIGMNQMGMAPPPDSSKLYQHSQHSQQQSMFSVMQQHQMMGLASNIVADLYQRQKEKIMFLQNVTLGDEEISAALSRLFSQVIQRLYTKASMDSRTSSSFIQAAHKCEALLDKAMLDGKKLSREVFLGECHDLIADFGKAEEGKAQQNLTVFNTTLPEHPNVQANVLKKLQEIDSDPSTFMSPKSPGTFLGEKFGGLNLTSPMDQTKFLPGTTAEDLVAQLGIKKKKEGTLSNLFEQRAPVPEPQEDDSKSGEKKGFDDKAALDALDIECQMLQAILKESEAHFGVSLDDLVDDAKSTELNAEADQLLSSNGTMIVPTNDAHTAPSEIQWSAYDSTAVKDKDKDAPGSNLEFDLDEVVGLINDCKNRNGTENQPTQPELASLENGVTCYQPSILMSPTGNASQSLNHVVTPQSSVCVGPSSVSMTPRVVDTVQYTQAPMKTQSHTGKTRPSATRSHGKGKPYPQQRNPAPARAMWVNPRNPPRGSAMLPQAPVINNMASVLGNQPDNCAVSVDPKPEIPMVVQVAAMDFDEELEGFPGLTFTSTRLPPEK